MKLQIQPALDEEIKILDDAITDFNIVTVRELPRAIIKRLDFIAKSLDGKLVGGIQAMMVNWGILEVELLFVFEEYRKGGIGALLLKHVEQIAAENSCYLAHLDTFGFQAKDFYLKQGYKIFGVLENAPKGYERFYMKKILNDSVGHSTVSAPKKITRTGVYGVVMDQGKLLVIRQKRGPYAGKFDFPGGGIEFGESAEQALRREFAEELGMEFDSMQLIENLTATIEVPQISSSEPYSFYQIGMIYRVNGCRLLKDQKSGTLTELEYAWVDLKALSEGECSKLLWTWKIMK